VVPGQHDDRDTRPGQLGEALGELALVGLVRVARLVRIAREDRQLDLGFQGNRDGFRQGVAEVYQTGRQPRLRVGGEVRLAAGPQNSLPSPLGRVAACGGVGSF